MFYRHTDRTSILQMAAARIIYNPYCHRAKAWHLALRKKKKAVLELLEAQKVIKEVEAEAAEHVPGGMLACFRSQCYFIEDVSSDKGHFIAAVSAIGYRQV